MLNKILPKHQPQKQVPDQASLALGTKEIIKLYLQDTEFVRHKARELSVAIDQRQETERQSFVTKGKRQERAKGTDSPLHFQMDMSGRLVREVPCQLGLSSWEALSTHAFRVTQNALVQFQNFSLLFFSSGDLFF